MSTESPLTAMEYLSSQLLLEREAKELMPCDPNCCTYVSGALRQQIYACLTCFAKTSKLSGVCYSCSIQCHSDHNIVELFTKRNFTCDCGTIRTNWNCNLRSKVNDDIPSSSNIYNHNFKGQFCDCSQDYNPTEETGNMLQCILGDVCNEDWFHDYCIMGLPKFKPETMKDEKESKISIKDENKEGVNILDDLKEPGIGEQGGLIDEDIAIDGFPRLDDFDCFICWKCVSNNSSFFNLIKDDKDIVNDILYKVESKSIKERNEKLQNLNSSFHKISSSIKRIKTDYEYSIFLNHNHEANFINYLNSNPENPIVASFFKKFQFLLKDEPIYEPPPEEEEEDDDTSSIFDSGVKALNSLPRDQAIQGVQAYEDIKDKLKSFLAPFAQNGQIVNKEDIESFFKTLKK